MKKNFIPVIIIPAILTLCFWQSHNTLRLWEELSLSDDKYILIGWMKESAVSLCRGEKNVTPPAVALPDVYGRAGLFVTLIKNGKVRGCFGAFDHRDTDTAMLLRKYLKGALSYDPRYRPLELYELEETDIVITVSSQPEQVNDLNNVDISRFGVFIECEGKAGTVIVPAEFKTTSRLNRKNSYSNCRINRFRAVTIREDRK